VGRQSRRYYALGSDGFERGALLEELQRLKRGDLETREIRTNKSLYDRFVALAFLLLVLESLLPARKQRKQVAT